jgi:hypothetical protein
MPVISSDPVFAVSGAHELRQANRSGSAGHVLDLDDSREPAALDHLLERARRLIPPAARRCRRDNDEVIVERLGPRRLRKRPRSERRTGPATGTTPRDDTAAR